MSVLVSDPIPTPVAVQDAAKALGVDVAIDDAQVPFDGASGFRPMTFAAPKSMEAGVEIYVENAGEFARSTGVEVDPQFTRVIWFRFAQMKDLYSACIASAALESLGAKVFSDEEGIFKTSQQLMTEAQSVLRLVRR